MKLRAAHFTSDADDKAGPSSNASSNPRTLVIREPAAPEPAIRFGAPRISTFQVSLTRPALRSFSPILLSLTRLFGAVNRLAVSSHVSSRERIAIPASRLELLRKEPNGFAPCCGGSHAVTSTAALHAMYEINDLIDTAVALMGQRFRITNWTTEVGVIWLRLQALTVWLAPVAPDIAMRLARALTGQPPAWPLLEGMQGVRLTLIPDDVISGGDFLMPIASSERTSGEGGR